MMHDQEGIHADMQPRMEDQVTTNNQGSQDTQASQDDHHGTEGGPTHYVGIGASAGGLEAIETFFSNMPGNSRLAFIVIQHLSPDYKSLMVELLSKKTPMPVHRVEDGMEVEANHVYLIPPKKNLTIFHGRLLLNEQDYSKGINLPIDVFLRSLSEDQGEKAVAVILSGTGSDGMRGVRSIKEYGGMVMVQDERSARFDGMPRAAASTGLADFILPAEEMPEQLIAYAKHPYMTKGERSESLLKGEDDLSRIFSVLRERCKVDFTYYKPSTVSRRIERRMTINQIESLQEYVSYLRNYPGEAGALFRELLIGVTSFFRDTEAFERLGDSYLPELFREVGEREVRFWVCGCSTGEEAYSLAILARETLEQHGLDRNLKIFATDVDRDAIHFAASGSYPESIAADLPPRILGKYFHKVDDAFRVSRSLREMVVFAEHNLIKNPPFTNIDLISCRNLLIYLQPNLQNKIIDFFNFSLNPAGILFLGSSETTGDLSDYFVTLDSKNKIYRSKGKVRQISTANSSLAVTDTRFREMRGRFANVRHALKAGSEERVLERFLDSVVNDFIPLAVIVNDQMEVLHVFGDTEGLFKLPAGKLTNDISKMAAKDLAIPLSTGIQKVFRQRKELRFTNISVKTSDGTRMVNLRILPLPERTGHEPLVAALIGEGVKRETSDDLTEGQSFDMSEESEQRIRDLEQELQFSRENLQATIEELETSNEELQATNEELLASNEELQSTNEELQSTNEELHTVNAQYHTKIIELTELHNDVDNLLALSDIGKLLLDENLEIRRFSPKVTEIFQIIEGDIGRSIAQVNHDIKEIDPVADIRKVQETTEQIRREIQTRNGKWYLMRIVPYVIGPDSFSGTMVSFVEITEVKEAQRELEENEARFRSLVNILDYSPASVEDFLDHVLEEALKLTRSPLGYIYYYDEASHRFSLNSWSKEAMKECHIIERQTEYVLEETGIWGEVVRQRKPIIVNDFQAPNQLKKGYPQGHVQLDTFMTLPVFRFGSIVGVVGVANRDEDYCERDVRQLKLLMDAAWNTVDKIRAEKALESNDRLPEV